MLVYRLICALLMAWAVNLALSRPEGQPMLEAMPHMQTLSMIAAGIVGYFNLAVRQGWGFIVGFANGIWAGVLSILVTGVLAVVFTMVQMMRENIVQDFDDFLVYFWEIVDPLLQELPNVPLLVVSLGSTAVVGVITEIIHFLLVRVRGEKGPGAKKPNA